MPSLWFCVPVHGRLPLAQICLRQLRRTCDALTNEGIAASAVIVGEPRELRTLHIRGLGFAGVPRDNQFLGRKFNDGIQLATDPRYNPNPADYIVPLGSDDWVDHRLFRVLPPPDTLYGFQVLSFVSEDGSEISSTILRYEGGAGIRIIPAPLVAELGYRPADEDRRRACDMSILRNLRVHHGDHFKVEHRHLHDRQIVDWKNPDTQLNTYSEVIRHSSRIAADPFTELAEFYPAEALEEMRVFYSTLREPVAA